MLNLAYGNDFVISVQRRTGQLTMLKETTINRIMLNLMSKLSFLIGLTSHLVVYRKRIN